MISSVNVTADLVTFTEEILNGKLHILCSVISLRREVYPHSTDRQLKPFLLDLSITKDDFFVVWLTDESTLAIFWPRQLPEAVNIASLDRPRTAIDLEPSLNNVSPDSVA